MGEVQQIQYADGKEVRLSYNALRQLEEIEDWLGITRIENNARGRATKVTYPNGSEVGYTYGPIGEKIGVIYPDGAKVGYAYDELKRLAQVTDKVGSTTYAYDAKGHLQQKQYPSGTKSLYAYTEKGQLESLTHEDATGILDRYQYTYDIQGNKTQIDKKRRGLETESGIYKIRLRCTATINRSDKRWQYLKRLYL